jgi:hypothetical protein
MLQRTTVTRSKLSEILASLRQTQRTIWATSHSVGIRIVLTVVLPKTHGTELETTTLAQCSATTTGAAIHHAPCTWSNHRAMVKDIAVILKPPLPTLEFLWAWLGFAHGVEVA